MAENTAARNNALPYPVYGVPWMVALPILDDAGDPVTGAADLDNEISKNNDAFADAGTEAEIGNGWYSVALTASDMTADIITGALKSSTADTVDTLYSLYPRKLVELETGTAQGGAAGYITLAAGTVLFDGQFNGCLCVATIDGTVEARIIQASTKSDQHCTVTPEWVTATPDSNDTYKIYLPEGLQIPAANVTMLGHDEQSLTDLKDFADDGYDPTSHESRSNVTSKVGRVFEYADTTGNWETAGTWASGSEPTAHQTAGICIKGGVTVTITTQVHPSYFGEYIDGGGSIAINYSGSITVIPYGWKIGGVQQATISTNKGRISSLTGTVTGNSNEIDQVGSGGTVGTNSYGGSIRVNNGTVTNNYGIIYYNNGTVTNNYGIILFNAGTVTENKAGGVINNYGGTIGTDNGHTWEGPATATAIVDEWETQSQDDPTGFHVNVKEVNGTAASPAGTVDANVTAMAADVITAAALAASAGQEIAALVEQYIVNEGDATAVMQAIADVIASDWVAGDASPVAIAAAVKTALEAEGTKLDHLWETTEDDGGVRRFTENALEQGRGTNNANTTVPDEAGTAATLHSATDALITALAAMAPHGDAMRGTDGANTVTPPTVSQMNARTLESAAYATAANQTTLASGVAGVPAAVWSYGTRTLTSLSALVASIATAVWAATTRTLTGTGGGVGPTAGVSTVDIRGQVFKNSTRPLCARVYLADGTDAQQADIDSITYTVYELDDPDGAPDDWDAIAAHTAKAVTVADVIFDTLQDDAIASDYNFKHSPDVATLGDAFEEAGRTYLVVYTLVPTAGGQNITTRFRLDCI